MLVSNSVERSGVGTALPWALKFSPETSCVTSVAAVSSEVFGASKTAGSVGANAIQVFSFGMNRPIACSCSSVVRSSVAALSSRAGLLLRRVFPHGRALQGVGVLVIGHRPALPLVDLLAGGRHLHGVAVRVDHVDRLEAHERSFPIHRVIPSCCCQKGGLVTATRCGDPKLSLRTYCTLYSAGPRVTLVNRN